jgi:hypothetical protein
VHQGALPLKGLTFVIMEQALACNMPVHKLVNTFSWSLALTTACQAALLTMMLATPVLPAFIV